MIKFAIHVYINMMIFFFSHIQLPPFPAHLQIMADLGFANIQPVITPACMNVLPPGAMQEAIRRC